MKSNTGNLEVDTFTTFIIEELMEKTFLKRSVIMPSS